ncbi:uncharacterized protein Dmoj_GI25836 [Drosophila mojavensis]|uniref:Uncharacterized protein n=1 Tax=Drosophila mojavensis TaxID=7230 RepID=A0A0Q9XBD7_DROMO|nr:uncharacterized protein Dmoj_GI25836 [Drosophila mojavensis]
MIGNQGEPRIAKAAANRQLGEGSRRQEARGSRQQAAGGNGHKELQAGDCGSGTSLLPASRCCRRAQCAALRNAEFQKLQYNQLN